MFTASIKSHEHELRKKYNKLRSAIFKLNRKRDTLGQQIHEILICKRQMYNFDVLFNCLDQTSPDSLNVLFRLLTVSEVREILKKSWAEAILQLHPFEPDHFFWRRKAVKEAAYTELGRRRLTLKDKTPELALEVLLMLDTNRSDWLQAHTRRDTYHDIMFVGGYYGQTHLYHNSDECIRLFREKILQNLPAFNYPHLKHKTMLSAWRLCARKSAGLRGQ